MKIVTIIESGSTKTDWCCIHERDGIFHFHTEGYNPATGMTFPQVENQETLVKALRDSTKIVFYGAGVVGEHSYRQVENELRLRTNSECAIQIYEDMYAAVHATAPQEEAFVAILGTGSNACYHDGKGHITTTLPTLGFILSDEGGGTSLGKAIVKAYFYNQLPPELKDKFEAQFSLTKDAFLSSLYKGPNPAGYLASFTKFLAGIDHPWKDQLLRDSFIKFFQARLNHPKGKDLPIHFVGSIASNFQKELRKVAEDFGFNIGSILEKPIAKLISYHVNGL